MLPMKLSKNILLIAITLMLFTETYSQGFLKASGKQIVNEKNENVLLRGMGLGGWMLQEGYMLKLQGVNPQFSIRNRIIKLVGEEKTQTFYNAWLSNFITKADIDSMHAWGFNSVRLPMHYNLFTPPIEKEKDANTQTWLTKGFALTDSLLSWCKANNMYLILDLHAAPGGQGNDINIADRDTTKPSLWQSEANKTKTIELWRKLAERYKDEPNIAAYDILNEPNWGFENTDDLHGQKETGNKPLKQLYIDITNAIRSADKKHIIIIEGNAWGNNYKGMFPLWDDNMVLSFHKYWNNNDKNSIQYILDYRNQYNVPVWLGETGENSNTWFADAVQLFEENNIGWSWWPLKKLGNNNPLQIKLNDDYARLVDYWNNKTATAPASTEAFNGLMQFANDANIRNNIVHRDVIDALFRQPFSNATLPFKTNIIDAKNSIINAVDYDLGRNNFAYFDKDTGNYYISAGGRSAGNKGNIYRNDGVDIYKDSMQKESYYVGSINDSEWIQYTVNITETAAYKLQLNIAAATAGNVSITVDDKNILDKKDITATGSPVNWQLQTLGNIQLSRGLHVMRIYFNKGGFNLKALLLSH